MGSQVVFYLTPLVTGLLALLVTPRLTSKDGPSWLELRLTEGVG